MSAARAHIPDADERARRRITQTLGGPVMVRLAGLMPELAHLTQDQALETVLNDCGLLHRCFTTFRSERPRFRDLLLDRRHQPVENDNTQLLCGRSVNQIIAMVVRSAAKRHFRRRLEQRPSWPRRSRLENRTQLGWTGMLGWMANRPPSVREKPPADQLYDSIRQYLLHDWQVPIIPQYARMTPPEVRALGSHLLDFRDAGALARYLDGGLGWQQVAEEPPPTPVDAVEALPMPVPPPLPPSNAPVPVTGMAALPSASLVPENRASLSQVLSRDGRSLRMETLVPILVRPEIKAALGQPSQNEMLLASRLLARTGPGTVRRLVVDFGLPAEQMTVMLTAAALVLPQPVFERLFGRQGDATLVLALVGKARQAGLAPDRPPEEFGAFMRELFGRFGR